MRNKLWVEKYRPTNLSDFLFANETQEHAIRQLIKKQEIPHLLLSGIQGSGKTTIAKIIINSLDIDPSDVLTINASDENNVEVIRDKIKTFITTASFSSDYKVVHLSEADFITLNGQAILRSYMEEEYTDVCRFILTCNYVNKIMPAIKSRCQHIEFKVHDKNKIAERIATILISEKVACDLDAIDSFVDEYSPDIRKIINEVQSHCVNGKLVPPSNVVETDYIFSILEYLNKSDWKRARQTLHDCVDSNQWEQFYSLLYDNISNLDKCKENQNIQEECVIIIADHLYKHALVADPYINAAAMIIKITQL